MCRAAKYLMQQARFIGLNLLPGEDAMNVEFFDTLTLQTSYKQEDSLRTDAHLLYELQATNHQLMIGKYVDPVFGETSAELFTQVKPSAVFSNTNKTYDSLFLNLAYIISNYGDTSALQTFLRFMNSLMPCMTQQVIMLSVT